MRIIQLIDSLEAGGAERMAVHYANVLNDYIDFSGLVVSRKEGILFSQIHKTENYLFLNRKNALDLKALLKFRNFIKINKIEIIHAHGTSFFLGFLLKIIYPNIKLVWHEHYGNRVKQKLLQYLPLWLCSFSFSIIFVVNRELEIWAKERLFTKKIFYISNFPIFETTPKQLTILKGLENKRILCLANLKKPKNHQFLIEIAAKLKESNPDWTFHLMGKVYDDAYSREIKDLIVINKLGKNVFIYNSKLDIENILNQSTIAILTSESEGLPVALLEYGLSSKAVIATSVGQIPMIIENNVNGILIESGNVNQFHKAIVRLIENTELISIFGLNLNTTILQRFDSEIIIKSYLDRLIKI